MSILDLVLIGIVAISALIGLSKGFFKSLFSFFGWLISILMAFSLAELIANRLMGETVINILIGSDSIYEFIYGILPESIKNIKIETAAESTDKLLAVPEDVSCYDSDLLLAVVDKHT